MRLQRYTSDVWLSGQAEKERLMSQRQEISIPVRIGQKLLIPNLSIFSTVGCPQCMRLAASTAILSTCFRVLGAAKDLGRGHGSLSFDGGTSSAFAGMRHFSADFSMRDFTKFATGCVKRSEFRACHASLKKVVCVLRSILRSQTSSNVPIWAIVVSLVLIQR